MRAHSRSILLAIIATGLSSTASHALSSQYYGKWTDHRGKCGKDEYIYRITATSFSRYESNCRIVKEEAHDPMKLGLPSPKLTLSCDSEGEVHKDIVYLDDAVMENQFKIQYESENKLGFRWLFRCRK